ncbi:hypothetical protein, partial [Intestinimonas butyriciproducens]|uniref:hypothetical protein n=1 Tax=Intestinimonas butyriciproducens TaxID=1297617 RepID=UPI00195D7408
VSDFNLNQSAKSCDLCVAFCTSQGASVRQRRARSPLRKLAKVDLSLLRRERGLFCCLYEKMLARDPAS